MEDQLALLRKSPSVPNFVHTFNIFAKTYLSLPELDILEFEYSLLPPDRKFEDLYDPSTLPNIVIKLLKGCGQAYVREDTCFDILRNLVTRKWHLFCQPDVICPFAPIITPAPGSTAETPPQGEGETVPELNLFSSANPSVDFHSLQSAVKVTCLLVILNSWMMNYLVKINFVDNIEAAILRISPVGMDQRGNKYFYMCGTRLYKESGQKCDGGNPSEDLEWELVASTVDEFEKVIASLKKLGTTTRSRSLISCLETKILPGLHEHFDAQHMRDLERRATLRRRRSAAVQIAREQARKDRQHFLAAKKLARADGGSSGVEHDAASKSLSRAERYKRRSMLTGFEDREDGFMESGTRRNFFSPGRIPKNRNELLEKARVLLDQLMRKSDAEWPVLS